MFNEIVFILEICKKRGLGHWFRCLALSKSLKENNPIRITWLLDMLPNCYKTILDKEKINYKVGKFRDVYILQNTLKKMNTKVIILDLMDLEKDYVNHLKKLYKTISIGGSKEGVAYTNISVNGMIKRKGFIDEFYGDQLYTDVKYIILRPDILKYQNKKLNKGIKKIYISLGGDYRALGVKIAKLLNRINPNFYIYVVLGANTNIEKYSVSHPIKILKNIENPGRIMKDCDIAITAGGMTTFELLYIGVPIILISITDFQRYPCKVFQDNGIGIYLGEHDDENLEVKLKGTLKEMDDFHKREKMVQKGQMLIDGKGVLRVKEIILRELNRGRI
ncbi:glycosyltransferase [Crassaminicella profunda]|uniref:glycosyltransferase n=1 Tax=Crassaminicella profunda TaxID=1286698 RepID=UPI001CA70D88|nr:glycosyltransferase [Crassaminicella profunda]QZY56320.1 hypothetical protein K7H06_04880 [Crassaminicella profunda]